MSLNRELLELAGKEKLPLKIFFYIPNIIDYARLACILIAFWHFNTNYVIFLACYVASHALDFVDGPMARRLGQCTPALSVGSTYGAMLDMILDRMATVSLLMHLAFLYSAWHFYFFLMALLDMVSHWYQMYS